MLSRRRLLGLLAAAPVAAPAIAEAATSSPPPRPKQGGPVVRPALPMLADGYRPEGGVVPMGSSMHVLRSGPEPSWIPLRNEPYPVVHVRWRQGHLDEESLRRWVIDQIPRQPGGL